MRALSHNLVIIPNLKLAQAIVINYHLPEKRVSLSIPVPVSYDCDIAQVERILLEEARKGAQEIPGLLAEPAPTVRLIPGFGNSSLDFTLGCQVEEFAYQYSVQHELRKRILMRFRQENINIPFPTRTVYLGGQLESGSPQQRANPSNGFHFENR
jgi:small-conductance mechanosensitive channel